MSELRAELMRKGGRVAVGRVPYCGQNKKIQHLECGLLVIKTPLSARAIVISIHYHPVCPTGYSSCARPVGMALRPPHSWNLKAFIKMLPVTSTSSHNISSGIAAWCFWRGFHCVYVLSKPSKIRLGLLGNKHINLSPAVPCISKNSKLPKCMVYFKGILNSLKVKQHLINWTLMALQLSFFPCGLTTQPLNYMLIMARAGWSFTDVQLSCYWSHWLGGT